MQPIQQINYSIADEKNWSVSIGYKGYGYAIKRDDGGLVCNVAEGLRPEEAALARMISATPDLLNALRKIWENEKVRSVLTYDQAITALEAIAKATGGNNV
jgi:hypothetical protein